MPSRCRICSKEIPEIRLELRPNVVTCSRACSLENTARNRRKAQAAYKARLREQKER